MAKRDYYEVLGLSKGASDKDIKKAYRTLAKQYHPDRNREAGAEEKFKEIQEAYEVLSDEQKKQAYDQYGFAGTQAFGGMGGMGQSGFGGDMGGFEDLLQGFFGGSFGGFSNSGFSNSQRNSTGEDLEVVIKIQFLEAVFGTEKDIKYSRLESCDDCDGTGSQDSKKKTCDNCGGSGKEARVQRTFLGAMQVVTTCSVCHGTGQIIENPCKKCSGKSVVKSENTFNMKIPAGIPDGVTLRFTEKGNAGKFSSGYGDLYVTLEVEPHAELERRGNDIYVDKHIDVVTAVLGGEVEVPSVHGNVKMKVPAGTQSEKILKLSGKGGPRFRSSGNGDQYVRLIVKIPEKLTKEQRSAWENLQKLS